MRRHGLVASAMQVFMRTNEFNKDPKYANQLTFAVEPTADSFALIGSAVRAAERIWRDGFRYAKAGVIFVDLDRPLDLPVQLLPSRNPERSSDLMAALDRVNLRYGRGTLAPGLVGFRSGWSMRRNILSPSYTTQIDELLIANA